MPSPFPGMDPWLEDPDVFPDLHNSMIARIRALMTPSLPPGYYASIVNRVYQEDEDWHREPDVNVHEHRDASESTGAVAMTIQYATAPVIIQSSSDPVDEWFLEIRNAPGDRLVTAVEILSPSNKRNGSRGREEYLNKQQEYLSHGASLIEIDLLRDGMHTTMVERGELLKQMTRPFEWHVCVNRIGRLSRKEVYPIALGEPLPTINIPLRMPTPDLQVSLQDAFAKSYEEAGYERRVNYRSQPYPPLTKRQGQIAENYLTEFSG